MLTYVFYRNFQIPENQPEIEIAINGQLTQIVSKIEDGIIPKNKASMVIRSVDI